MCRTARKSREMKSRCSIRQRRERQVKRPRELLGSPGTAEHGVGGIRFVERKGEKHDIFSEKTSSNAKARTLSAAHPAHAGAEKAGQGGKVRRSCTGVIESTLKQAQVEQMGNWPTLHPRS